MQIPCTECICLAMCKHKKILICDILYNFMDDNVSCSKVLNLGPEEFSTHRDDVWKQLGNQFRKKHGSVTIDKASGSTGMYMITDEDGDL